MSCPPLHPLPREPDLSVYYDAKEFRETTVAIRGDKIFTYAQDAKLSSSIELVDSIGKIHYQGTTSIIKDNVSDVFQLCISLPEGDMMTTFTVNDTLFEDESIFKPNKTYYMPIMAGTGNFAFAMGWIVLNTLDDFKRAVYIYIDPVCSPMPM